MKDLTPVTNDQVELIKRTFCKGATDDELALFMETAKRTGLSPMARQLFAVKRWDSGEKRTVLQTQISIDGQRLIAERSGKYAGQLGPLWCGADGKWTDVWLESKPPVAAKCAVVRTDFKEPLWAVARFDAYKQTKKDGNLNSMWAKMSDLMLAKCAEALALRKAFPQDLSGLYTPEEMGQDVVVEKVQQTNPQQSLPPVSYDVTKDNRIINASELKRLHTIRGKSEDRGWTAGDAKVFIAKAFNVDSSKKLTKANYELLCTAIQAQTYDEALSDLISFVADEVSPEAQKQIDEMPL